MNIEEKFAMVKELLADAQLKVPKSHVYDGYTLDFDYLYINGDADLMAKYRSYIGCGEWSSTSVKIDIDTLKD